MAGLQRIKVTPNQALVDALLDQGATTFANVLDSLSLRGEVFVAVNRIMAEEFTLGEKNNPIGSGKTRNVRQARRHLKGSIKVAIKWNRKSFPITIEVGSSADPHKVGALEYGTFKQHPNGYKITGNLAFPWSKDYTSPTRVHKAHWKSSPLTKVQSVDHPGVRGRHFMQRGLDEVLAKRLGL